MFGKWRRLVLTGDSFVLDADFDPYSYIQTPLPLEHGGYSSSGLNSLFNADNIWADHLVLPGLENPSTPNSGPGSNAEIETSQPSSSGGKRGGRPEESIVKEESPKFENATLKVAEKKLTGKNRGGRPKKMVTEETLLKCEKGELTLKEGAAESGVSVATLKRRRRTGKDKVQDEVEVKEVLLQDEVGVKEVQDEVEVQLVYQKRPKAFYIRTSEATEEEFRKRIKETLELSDLTNYDFKYSAQGLEFSLGSGPSFDHCMRQATRLSSRSHKSIILSASQIHQTNG